MNNRTKLAICYTAVVLSVIFLVVGVDYLPVLACWLPLIITGGFALQCKAFVESLSRIVNNIIPE